MTRIAILGREEMDAEQGRVFDAAQAAGGPTGGPFWAYIRNPALMRAFSDLHHAGDASDLPKRARQLAIMAIIRFWGAEFPWAVQSRAALAMGIGQDILDAINGGQTPPLDDPKEKMAWDVAVELLNDKKLSEATFRKASDLFGEKTMVELVATIGQFSVTCLTTIAYDCTPPADAPHRIKHL